MKRILGNLTLLGVTFVAMLSIGEVISRLAIPTSPGPSIKSLNSNEKITSYIEAGKKFTIITPDFSAETSITPEGYRAPQAIGKPDVLFVGDSFTYAQGVTDEETFPAIYCKERNISCANLGVPGASTLYEINRLASFIKQQDWKPKMVHFFFFTGNDFSDNIVADANRSKGLSIAPEETKLKEAEQEEKKFLEKSIDFSLKHSNLLRIAYYKVLPIFRNDPEAAKKDLEKALKITKVEFSKLEKLSKAVGFDYQIYIFHPESEISHELYENIDKKLQAQSSKPLISLAKLFKEKTKDHFFPADGHLNIKGNERVAEYLLSMH